MKRFKILIIEDEQSISEILTYKLKKEKFEVMSTKTGKEGLIVIPYFKPDLILLDIRLPDISGFNICKEIKNNYTTPVIMLTTRNNLKDISYGLALGAKDYITKPFDINDVLKRINCVLKKEEEYPCNS